MSHSSIHIPYKRTSSAVLSASAARRRRPDPFENDDTQEFLGDMSARIRRALRLEGDDAEGTDAASEASNIFHQDHSQQDFQLPSLAADQSVLGDDAANADESVLAAKAPAAPSTLEQADAGRDSDAEDTDAKVKAALDQSSSDSSDSESEEESELEDEEVEGARTAPTTQAKQDYTSTLQTPFRDGEPDAVKRIRAHLDPEAQDALYAQDQEDEEEREDDLDAQDDFEKWQRIPSELKGKAREDQQEADWFDDEEEDDDDDDIDIHQVNSGEYDYGNEYASGDDDQPLEPDPLRREDDQDSTGYDAEPDQSRDESFGSDQRESDQVDEEDGNDSSDLEIMPSSQKQKQEEEPVQELDASADTSLEIAQQQQQQQPASPRAAQGADDDERAAYQAATEQTGLPTPPLSPPKQPQDISLPGDTEEPAPPEAPTIESLLQLADQQPDNNAPTQRQDTPDFEALISQLSADAGIPPPAAPAPSPSLPSVSHTQQIASEAREAAAAAASVLPPTPPMDDEAQLPAASEPAAAEIDPQPVLNEQDILQAKGPVELEDTSAEHDGALQLDMKPPVTASAPALEADVQSDLNMISEEAEEEAQVEQQQQQPSASKAEVEEEKDTSMRGESEPDSSVEVKEDVMQESTPAIFAHVVDNIKEDAKQATADQGATPVQATSGQTNAADDAKERPPRGRAVMEDSSLADPPTSQEVQQDTTQAAAPVEQSSQVPLAVGDDQVVVNLPETGSPRQPSTVSAIPTDAPEHGEVVKTDDPATAVQKNDVLQEAAPAFVASAMDEQESAKVEQVSKGRAEDCTTSLPTTGQSGAQDESQAASAALHATAIEDPPQVKEDSSSTVSIPPFEAQEVVYGAGDDQAVLSLPPASSAEPASVTTVPSEAPLDGDTVQSEIEAGEIPEEPSMTAESKREELVQEAEPVIAVAKMAQPSASPGADRSTHDSTTEHVSGLVAAKDEQSSTRGSFGGEALRAAAVEDPPQARDAEVAPSAPGSEIIQEIPFAAGEDQAVLTAPVASLAGSASISTVPAEAPHAGNTVEAGHVLPVASSKVNPVAEEAETIPGLSFIPIQAVDGKGPSGEALPEKASTNVGDDDLPLRKDTQLDNVETPGPETETATESSNAAPLQGSQTVVQADEEEAEEGEISEEGAIQSERKSPPPQQSISLDIKSPRAARSAEEAASSSSEPSSSEPSDAEEKRTTEVRQKSKRRKTGRHAKSTNDKPAAESGPSRRRSSRLQRRDGADVGVATGPPTPNAPGSARKTGRSALRGTASEPAQQPQSSPTTTVPRSQSEVIEQSPASLRSPAVVERLQKGHSHHHRSRPERSSRASNRVNPDAPVTRSHCPFHHISLKSNVSQFRYHFLVPECSLARRWTPSGAQDNTDEFVDHGISGSPEHAFAVSLAEAEDAVNPEAEASLTRLVGPDLLGECDLLIPMPPREESAAQDIAAHEVEAGSGSNGSASSPTNVSHPIDESPAATKRPRQSSPGSDENDMPEDREPRRNNEWGWFRAVQGLLSRKRRKQG